MKRSLEWLTFVLVLFLAAPASAQDKAGKFGIGVSLEPSALVAEDFDAFFLPFGFGDIYFPINAGEQIKIEPQLGLFRFSSEATADGFSSKQTITIWRLGAGIFYRLPASESLTAYVGPRFVFLFSSESDEFDGSADDSSATDISIGAALGGEYFFSSHFSIGGEFQLNYVSLGDPDGNDTVDQSRSIISNNGLILLRWYF
ncbi:MAG: outer membrane beta-barrel protein [Gemmatimonadales bacterium]|jgi:hypothetical protein